MGAWGDERSVNLSLFKGQIWSGPREKERKDGTLIFSRANPHDLSLEQEK